MNVNIDNFVRVQNDNFVNVKYHKCGSRDLASLMPVAAST